jgi:hypothetical protein
MWTWPPTPSVLSIIPPKLTRYDFANENQTYVRSRLLQKLSLSAHSCTMTLIDIIMTFRILHSLCSKCFEFVFNVCVLVQYYSLPFCEGTGKQRRHKQDLGETLSGARKVHTPYEITFMDAIPWRSLCEEYLTPEDVSSHIA